MVSVASPNHSVPGVGWLPRGELGLHVPVLIVGILLTVFEMVRVRGSIMLSDVFLLLAAGFFVFVTRRREESYWLPWWFWLASLMMVFPALVQYLPDGKGPHGNLAPAVTVWFNLLATPVLIANLVNTPRALRMALVAWVGAALVAALVSLAGKFGVVGIGALLPQSARLQGVTGHPNALGLVCSIPLATILGFALMTRRHTHRLIAFLCIAVLLYVANLTGSRKAMVAAALGMSVVVGVWLSTSRSGRGWARITVVYFTGVTALLFLYLFVDVDETALGRLMPGSGTAQFANMRREVLAAMAWEDFWSSPLVGVGYTEFVRAHNLWLSMLRCAGVLGLLFLMVKDIGITSRLVRGVAGGIRSFPVSLVFVGLAMVYAEWLLVCIKTVGAAGRYVPVGIGLALAATRLHPNSTLRPESPMRP